jgi:excisionase family DNA binding protein
LRKNRKSIRGKERRFPEQKGVRPMSNNLTDSLFWTSRQAAKALAISERKLWDLTNEGAIPCIRIGRAVRYDPGDIRTWIDAQKNTARPPDTTAELS